MAKEEKEPTREELEARKSALKERVSGGKSAEKSEEELYSEGFRARMSDVSGIRIIKAEDVKKASEK
jgi:hypothetical protein